ncbi:hypothetical protein, partial [Oleiphilus sp. HI0128]|uniref:hypothetical protein n=1 Tax=Oleiphilus sp. HI0128 TaxID=1822267 RepID=UPI001E450ECC
SAQLSSTGSGFTDTWLSPDLLLLLMSCFFIIRHLYSKPCVAERLYEADLTRKHMKNILNLRMKIIHFSFHDKHFEYWKP